MSNRRPVHICLGGPEFTIDVNGKQMTFEMPPYCSLVVIDPDTGEELRRVPKAFWGAIDRWEKGGRRMNGQECLVPKWCHVCRGTGAVANPEMALLNSMLKRSQYVVPCSVCQGAAVRFP